MYDNIIDAIGHTPLVRINALNPKPHIPLYAKLEGFNPTGSIKDRIAIKMIEAFGAITTLTDAAQGTDGAIRRAQELCRAYPDKYFMPNQFSNEYNKIAHYETTANEIWEDTEGKVTHFVSALGTSGTIMGVGMGLKKKNPAIQIVEAHPVLGHYIQGLKNMEEAIVPAIYDPSQIDRRVMVESEAAFAMARKIVAEEGIFVGMSSGAAMYAAVECIKEIEAGFVVVLYPDRGEKYLSTGLFNLAPCYMGS